MRTFIFSFLILLCFLSPLAAEETPPVIFSKKIETPPLIDGNSQDNCWKSIPFTQVSPEKDLNIKVCHDEKNIYVMLSFSAPEELRHQGRWQWDKVLNAYLPEKEKEENMHIFISPIISSEKPGDLWIWRAGRTDPSGFAEDLYFYGKDKNIIINYDSGTICWYSRYFGKFAGEMLPRFFQRTPTGSAADVRARGKWSNGKWTLEFTRQLKTGNNDDLDIDLNGGILVRFSENGNSIILKKRAEK